MSSMFNILLVIYSRMDDYTVQHVLNTWNQFLYQLTPKINYKLDPHWNPSSSAYARIKRLNCSMDGDCNVKCVLLFDFHIPRLKIVQVRNWWSHLVFSSANKVLTYHHHDVGSFRSLQIWDESRRCVELKSFD